MCLIAAVIIVQLSSSSFCSNSPSFFHCNFAFLQMLRKKIPGDLSVTTPSSKSTTTTTTPPPPNAFSNPKAFSHLWVASQTVRPESALSRVKPAFLSLPQPSSVSAALLVAADQGALGESGSGGGIVRNKSEKLVYCHPAHASRHLSLSVSQCWECPPLKKESPTPGVRSRRVN